MLDRIIKTNNVRLQLANNMIDRTREVSINLRNILLLKDIGKTLELKNRIDSSRNIYDADFTKLEGLITNDDTMSFVIATKIKASQEASRQLNNKVIDLAMAGKYEEATLLMNQQASMSVQVWINDIDDLITHNEDRNIMRYLEAEKAHTTARLSMLILGAVATAMAIVISILLTLSITRPLNITVQTADMIASKDLTKDLSISEKRGDEFGYMMRSFSRMVEILREQMQEILDAVNIIASSSSEILVTTTQIASGSAETAAAITETTTTVEEVRQAAQLSSQKAKN